MNLTGFDKWLWRFNGIVIALCCLGIGLIIAFGLYGMVKNFTSDSTFRKPKLLTKTEQSKPSGDEFVLFYFSRVPGTSIISANLSERKSPKNESWLGSSSGSYSNYGWCRNRLFYDTVSGESFWLKSDNKTKFSDPSPIYDVPGAFVEGKSKVTGYIYTTIPYSPDKKAFDDQKKTVVFYNLEHRQLKVLVNDADSTATFIPVSVDKAVIIYTRNDEKCVLTFNPRTGDQISTKRLPDSPE